MNHKSSPDHSFKILRIGDDSVGKTSLINRLIDNTFSFSMSRTIGIDYRPCTLNIGDQAVKLYIWDTSGQENFKKIIKTFYPGADSIVFIYNICERRSFQDLDLCLKEVMESAKKDVKRLLIGNKCDWEGTRAVSYEEGQAYADKLGIKFFETSAKDGVNVEDAFRAVAKELMEEAPPSHHNIPLKKLRSKDDDARSRCY